MATLIDWDKKLEIYYMGAWRSCKDVTTLKGQAFGKAVVVEYPVGLEHLFLVSRTGMLNDQSVTPIVRNKLRTATSWVVFTEAGNGDLIPHVYSTKEHAREEKLSFKAAGVYFSGPLAMRAQEGDEE